MSNSFLGPKPVRSVAAFLWMPQFRLSFQHMSHLTPVFMRTLAMVFVQAGLLPRNHPATMYGIEGVKKYGFSEIIGEAWFTLRTTRATPNQWGLFIAVMLMIAMVIGSLATFMMTMAFGFGTPAQAQLFSHPSGSSAMDGSYDTLGSPFDTAVPDTAAVNAQGDYGIMLLNKVIRAGAYNEGIPLQTATRALMEIYNSGVLVVASVILFWIIISVVVDTAKTGQVGGGRHNMVWAPMRIVFALGLLIPLGTAGYSSGQYMVMKLAEWGSNLGTRAWTAYIDAALDSSNMLMGSGPSNPTDLVMLYQKMWICRVAYNANMSAGGNTDPDQWIVRKNGFPTPGQTSYQFSNNVESNICGTVTVDRGRASILAAIDGGLVPITDGLTEGIEDFKDALRASYATALTSIEAPTRNFACRFTAAFPQFQGAEFSRLSQDCNLTGPVTAFPNQSDFQAIVERFGNSIQAGYDAAFLDLSNASNADQMFANITQRGWAGMGIWYHRISQLNAAIASARTSPVTVSAGTFWDGQTTRTDLGNTRDIINRFDSWWALSVTQSPTTVQINPLTGESVATAMIPPDDEEKAKSLLSVFRSGNKGMMDTLVDYVAGGHNANIINLITSTSGGTTGDVYPMALLSNFGGKLFIIGTGLVAANVAANVALGVADAAASINVIGTGTKSTVGSLVAKTFAVEIIAKVGAAFMAAGMMLKFYIPLIPFIRVSFSVLTWIISVFEAVALVPIAALAHLTTEGEGLAGGAKQAWMLWLNVLLRPVLTVIGYVGAILVFNGFVAYFNSSFIIGAVAGITTKGILGLFTGLFLGIAYVFIMYTAANTVFKMLDLIPNALMRWMGGTPDQSFDDGSDRGIMYAASNLIATSGGGGAARDRSARKNMALNEQKNKPGGGAGDGGS